jgi:hypothetical protein
MDRAPAKAALNCSLRDRSERSSASAKDTLIVIQSQAGVQRIRRFADAAELNCLAVEGSAGRPKWLTDASFGSP